MGQRPANIMYRIAMLIIATPMYMRGASEGNLSLTTMLMADSNHPENIINMPRRRMRFNCSRVLIRVRLLRRLTSKSTQPYQRE